MRKFWISIKNKNIIAFNHFPDFRRNLSFYTAIENNIVFQQALFFDFVGYPPFPPLLTSLI